MLQSLLPGFRHLRAPLAAGFIWIIALWLLLREFAINQAVSEKVHQGIVELANWAGKPATLAALTVIAYLVGTLSIATTRGIIKLARSLPWRQVRLEWMIPRYWADKRMEESLQDVVDRRLSEHYVEDESFRDLLTNRLSEYRNRALREHRELNGFAQRLPDVTSLERQAIQDDFVRWRLIDATVSTDQYLRSAKEDIDHLAYRLLGKEEQVYAEYDRLRSEGTFRLSLSVPLSCLCFVLAYIDNWWWLTGLVIPVAFAYLAGASFAEAKQGLVAVVLSGRVELPSLERIRTADVALAPYNDVLFDQINEGPEPYVRPIELPEPYLRQRRWFDRFL